MIPRTDLPNLGDIYARSAGAHRTGRYYQTNPAMSVTTSNTLGNGTLRVTPFVVPRRVSLTKIGLEVTSGGDAASTLRIGIYADDGAGYPGALVLDAGTVAGDAIAVAEITIALALEPGLYWTGAVVQGVTVTQPTVRSVGATNALHAPFIPLTTGTTPIANAPTNIGYAGVSITGALPSPFPTTMNVTAVAARLFVKVA